VVCRVKAASNEESGCSLLREGRYSEESGSGNSVF
jgi:hypothetical protein